MEKLLLIAEKPSIMRELQATYKNHKSEIPYLIDFVALSGHVCQYKKPKGYSEWDLPWADLPLPMIPDKWQIDVNKDKMDLFQKIKNQYESTNYDGLICATDSDREGNLIYYFLESKLGLRKKKTYRMWLHAETDEELLKAFKTMTDFHNDKFQVNLTYAAILRSQFDWLVGMNATVAATNRSGMLMKIGRVKSPTLKLVYDNSMAIDNFKSTTTYGVTSDYGNFSGELLNENEPADFKTRQEAEDVIKTLGDKATVKEVTVKREKTAAPQLYKLSDVQIDASRKFGYSAAKTLELVQSLYETHKLVSYPRCDCRYISTSQMQNAKSLIDAVSVFPELKSVCSSISQSQIGTIAGNSRYVNDKEVSKSSHTALMPTGKMGDLSKLKEEEQNVLKLIYSRFLSIFMPPLVFDRTIIITANNGRLFRSEGKVVVDKGFSAILDRALKDVELPKLNEGDVLSVKLHEVKEKVSKPPARLTEGRLIAEMENISKYIDNKELKSIMKKARGIGTQATRGAIISDLIKSGYIDKKKSGKNEFLYISDVGKKYIENLLNHELVNPDLTAEWEEKLSDVEQGNKSPKEFSDEMKRYVTGAIGQIESQSMQGATKPKSEKIGKCPCCGRGVYESKKGFYCEGFKDKNEKCEFFLWRDNPFLKKGHKMLTSTIVKQLLKTGTATVSGLQFQSGRKCSVTAILETHDTGRSKINFEFLSKKSKI